MRPRLLPTRLRQALLVGMALALCSCGGSVATDVRVCAAASLSDLLPALDAAWRAEDGQRAAITPVLAGSGVLARQLADGLPADVFISANVEWMNHVEQAGALQPGSRRALFANQLVLIAPTDSTVAAGEVAEILASLPTGARLAIANPETVPAGDWTRRALAARDLWADADRRSLNLPHVRACLAAVVSGDAPVGFVYRSDATAATDRVRVLATLADARVVYHGAVLRQARNADAAAAFLEWIATAAAAKNRLLEAGFLPLPADQKP